MSTEYFADKDPFADFVVHEAAHVFHNCKRETIGLKETRCREWLLDIDFNERETFAYSCEAYSRILERAHTPAARRQLAAQYSRTSPIDDDRVDPAAIAAIVVDAAAARNGWKVILSRCGARKLPRGVRFSGEDVALHIP